MLMLEHGTGQEYTKIIAKRMVAQGDSLSELAEQVYGSSTDEFLKFVKDNNPHIKNIHSVRMGSIVNFHELPKYLKPSQEGP